MIALTKNREDLPVELNEYRKLKKRIPCPLGGLIAEAHDRMEAKDDDSAELEEQDIGLDA